ncbi:protein kinase domain-containing protein [Terrimicrobium sacchariphilum]|nr:protein kinase [Terrimicrobium sacchariphilum]
METSPRAPLRAMLARVSPDDLVIYANASLCQYLGVSKRDLVGTPLDVLAARCQGEISTCFVRDVSHRTSNHLVTDAEGRVFEAKVYSEGGVLDIVLDEVSSTEFVGSDLRYVSGTPFESLEEDELRTARLPERRYITIGHTQLRGLSEVSERSSAMDVRLLVNCFIEEAGDAIWESGCTVGEIQGGSILGIYGAPRYFADHPLRAIRAACEQMAKMSRIHGEFLRQGKELPPCSCGLWTGDTLVGSVGNSYTQHYTALGKPVELARRLSDLARPGETILPEHTLTHLLRVLPPGWQHVRAENSTEPDLSDFQWVGDEVAPLPENLKRIVYLVGPDVQNNASNAEYYFDYLWSFRVPGRDQTVPILRVVRPQEVGDSLELRDDNVISQSVQTVGKYKLIEVVGTGGMGKVWRGIDRFGNSVAIKVLHTAESVTEAQLKRFRREAEVMARLPHRNICRVYEMNEFEGIHYLAMEFVNGLPLYDLLYESTPTDSEKTPSREHVDLPALISSIRSAKSLRDSLPPPEGENGPEVSRPKDTRILPVEQTLNIFLKVCDAVQFAHEHGVLHRDLKPGNILLREDGEPLVADFGLAKLSADGTHSLSVTGHVVGTLENMAPEQAESSKDVDERADVYSLGTILYQMLTGRRHFEATGNIIGDAQALQSHEPPKLRSINPNIDPDLEIITLKALRNDPAERYRNVAALSADIGRFRKGEVISAKPVQAIDLVKKLIQRNRAVAAVTAASILVFITGTLVAIVILSRQLKRAQDASDFAHQQQAFAEEQRALAEMRRRAAEDQETKARAAQVRAEEQEKIARDALDEARRAKELGAEATALTETERKRREEAEKNAQANEQLLRETRERMENLRIAAENSQETHRAAPADASPDPSFEEQMKEAIRISRWDLAPLEVQRLARTPSEIIRRVSSAIDQSSMVLLANPTFAPAWLLKGRMHLALLECDLAADSFAQAAKYGKSEIADDALRLHSVAQDALKSFGDRPERALSLLSDANLPGNESTVAIIKTLSEKNSRRSAAVTETRIPSSNEVALSLLTRNPGISTPTLSSDSSGRFTVTLKTSGDLNDLSPLKPLNVSSLTIQGATGIDWNSLLGLPLEKLALTDCRIDSLPMSRTLLRVKSIDLSGSRITSIDALRLVAALEDLSLANTYVGDLSPLAGSRYLRRLDISGLNPAGIRVLAALPLDSLTLSPEIITDLSWVAIVRNHRSIKILRTPNDPADQKAADFFQRIDHQVSP